MGPQPMERGEAVSVQRSLVATREAVGEELGIEAYADHRPLLGQIDAAIIAVPSRLHHAVAIDLVQHGVHVFVEKPMTLNVGDADELIAEAAARCRHFCPACSSRPTTPR